MKIELDIPSLLTLYGALLGSFLTLVFLLLQRGNRWANIFLGLLLGCMSAFLVYDTLWELGLLTRMTWLIRTAAPLGYLIGPLLYFYILSCITGEFRFKPVYALHLLPWAAEFLYLVFFFFFEDPQVKLAYLNENRAGFFTHYFPLLVFSKALHMLAYLVASWIKVERYRRHVPKVNSRLDPRYHWWLYLVSLIVLMLGVSILALLATDYRQQLQLVVDLHFLLLVFSVQVTAFVMPEIFYGFPAPLEEVDEKYKGSSLQDEDKEAYHDRLKKCMEQERPYLEPDLTLGSLAELLTVPPHHLSQVINERTGSNFMDFVNAYRIAEAKKKLHDPKFGSFTVLAIAFEVGFNSKSAFYSAFKKFAGMTPSEFRRQPSTPQANA